MKYIKIIKELKEKKKRNTSANKPKNKVKEEQLRYCLLWPQKPSIRSGRSISMGNETKQHLKINNKKTFFFFFTKQ